MTRSTIDELNARLRHVQRSLAVVAAGLVATVVLLVVSRTSTTYAESRSFTAPFTVVSESGKKLMEVRDTGDGAAICVYYHETPAHACLLGTPDGGLLVTQSSQRATAKLGATNAGDGALVLWDSDQQLLADISRGAQGAQGLAVYSEGVAKAFFFAAADGRGIATVRGGAFEAAEDDNTMIARLGKPAPFERRGEIHEGSASGAKSSSGISEGAEDGASDGSKGGPGEGEADKVEKDGLAVFNEGIAVVQAYRNSSGNGSLSLHAKSDQAMAALVGVTPSGPALTLNAAGGAQRAALAVLSGQPTFEMKNRAGAGVVHVGEGDGGSGQLQLCNKDGNTMVEAGLLQNGHGIVPVYPWKATQPGMLLGLPGTYIVGAGERGGRIP